MKTRILFLVAGCMLSALSIQARAQDTTRSRTLFSYLPFRGAHISVGGGVVPYLDNNPEAGGAAEYKIALTLRRYPDWSVAFISSAVIGTDTTSYVAPGSATATSSSFHPHLASVLNGIEVQRRWSQRRLLHGIATFSAGSIVNSYNYFTTVNREYQFHEDEKRQTSFAQIAGGGELNVARWLRADLLVGYRSGGRMTIPQARGANGGITTMLNVAMGKF